MNTNTIKVGALFFLLHPGETQFSGFGLTVEAGSAKRLVGLLIVDRPKPVSRTSLAKIERTYGRYELHVIAKSGERGIACQMRIAEESLAYVRQLEGAYAHALQETLFPMLLTHPNPQFVVSWDKHVHLWRSEFDYAQDDTKEHDPSKPQARFVLGHVVATPAALEAIEEAG